jgi:hypothetical protein
MKRYWIRPSGSSTVFAQPHPDGEWVRAEDAKRLMDVLITLIDSEEVAIYPSAIEQSGHGFDFEEWEATARAALASCSLPTTDDQD